MSRLAGGVVGTAMPPARAGEVETRLTIERAAVTRAYHPMVLDQLMGSVKNDDESAPFWAKLLDRFGLPTVTLVAISFAIYWSVSWSATEIVKPMANAHLQFLSQVSENVKAQATVMQELSKNQAAMIATQSQIAHNQDEILKILGDQAERLKAQEAKTRDK